MSKGTLLLNSARKVLNSACKVKASIQHVRSKAPSYSKHQVFAQKPSRYRVPKTHRMPGCAAAKGL